MLLGGTTQETMSIFLLHNKWSRVDGLCLTFLHYQPRKKPCLLTLISACEAANSIPAWKQTELVLDPDNVPGANQSWKQPFCSLFLGRMLACLRSYWGGGGFFIGNVVKEYS